ncbi:MAG: ketopantoate reductase family protein [Candidatus Latescibacteria bacterium]|jgi:2-dehydropantoate 2-reductase|nr:ketopantoate reductase family protein [Candidatus Latescibacterota bacterium]
MQVAVIGAGNMGCVYGANLARVGEDVTMLDVVEDHVAAMRDHGLQMAGLHGEFTAEVFATIDPAEAPKADWAIVTVNAYNTREAAEAAQVLLKDDGFVLTLQNGLGNIEILTEMLGEDRVMAGLTFHSGDLKAPGQVTHTNKGPTYLGELDRSKSDRLITVYECLLKADVEPVLEPDIMATIWGKFVHNCGLNAICAITDLRPGNIREVPAVDEFQTKIIEETLALVEAKGIEIPEKDPMTMIKEYSAQKFHRVSMVQHLKRGRVTEIDALNGYVARESEHLGLKAPYSDALTMLIKGLQHIPVNKTEVGN